MNEGLTLQQVEQGGGEVSAPSSIFQKALALEHVDPSSVEGQLVDSLAKQESGKGTNGNLESNRGAIGPGQLLQKTFDSVADKGWDIRNPLDNYRGMIRYARQMLQSGGGDPFLAAAGYYGGPEGQAKARMGEAVRDRMNPNAPDTLQYARQVVGRMKDGGRAQGGKGLSLQQLKDQQESNPQQPVEKAIPFTEQLQQNIDRQKAQSANLRAGAAYDLLTSGQRKTPQPKGAFMDGLRGLNSETTEVGDFIWQFSPEGAIVGGLTSASSAIGHVVGTTAAWLTSPQPWNHLKDLGKAYADIIKDPGVTAPFSPFTTLNQFATGNENPGLVQEMLSKGIDRALRIDHNQSVTDPVAKRRQDELKAYGAAWGPMFMPLAFHAGRGIYSALNNPKLDPALKQRVSDAKGMIDSAVTLGQMTPEAAKFTKWAIDKNPQAMRDLTVQVGEPTGAQVSATYNPASKLMSILNVKGDDWGSGVHEIMHHVETMLPPEVRVGVTRLWDAGLKGLGKEELKSLKDLMTVRGTAGLRPDEWTPEQHQALQRLDEASKMGMDLSRLYRFTSPSEFWAEGAREFLEDRFGKIAGGWVGQARGYLRDLSDHLESAWGTGVNSQVVKGLRAIGKTRGQQQSSLMLQDQFVNQGLSPVPQSAVPMLVGLEGLKSKLGEEKAADFYEDTVAQFIKGENPADIWRKRLMMESADGDFKRYVDDSNSYITRSGRSDIDQVIAGSGMKERTLGGFFQHPLLYELYPGLENIDFQLEKGGGSYFQHGVGSGGDGLLHVDVKHITGFEDPRSILVHEIQHAIQRLEIWGRGGSPSEFQRRGWTKEQALRAYHRLTGEAEARYAQDTLGSSLDHVRNLATPDLMMSAGGAPKSKQLVLYRGDKAPGLDDPRMQRVLASLEGMSRGRLTPLEEELMRASGASEEQIEQVKKTGSMEGAAKKGRYGGYGHAGSVLDILRQKEAEARGENGDGSSSSGGGNLPPLDASQDHQNRPRDPENSQEGGNKGKMVTDPKNPMYDRKQSSQSRNKPRPTPNIDETLGEAPDLSGVEVVPQFIPAKEVSPVVFDMIGDVLNKMEASKRWITNNLRDLWNAVPDVAARRAITGSWMGDFALDSPLLKRVSRDAQTVMQGLQKRAVEAGVLKQTNEDFLQKVLEGGVNAITPNFRRDVQEANLKQLLQMAKASGAHLVDSDLGVLYKSYAESLDRNTLRRGLMEYLRHPQLGLAWRSGKQGKAPAGWEAIGSTAWAGYYVHPDLIPALKFVFDHNEPQLLLKGAFLVGQTAKRIGVLGSLFHAASLLQSAWGSVGPTWVLKNMGLSLADKLFHTKHSALTQALELYKSNGLGGSVDSLMKAGLRLELPDDSTEGLLSLVASVADRGLGILTGKEVHPVQNFVKPIEDVTLGYLDRFTWDFLHSSLKTATALKLWEDAQRNHPQTDPQELAKHVVQFTNTAYGGLNWYDLANSVSNVTLKNVALGLSNRNGRMLLQTLFFAPDWTVSTVANFGQAFGKGSVKGMVAPKTTGDLARRYQFRVALTYLTLINGLNLALSGHPLWDNKDPTRIELGDGSTMQPMKHASEPYHWITEPIKELKNKLGFIPRSAIILLGDDYRKPMAKKWKEVLSQLIPFQLESGLSAPTSQGMRHFISGELGFPIYGSKKTPGNRYSTP